MAASSANSQPKGKLSIGPEVAVDARAALEILFSAVMLCQRAGLPITFINRQDRLALFVQGAECVTTDTGTTFIPRSADTGT